MVYGQDFSLIFKLSPWSQLELQIAKYIFAEEYCVELLETFHCGSENLVALGPSESAPFNLPLERRSSSCWINGTL